MKNKVVLVFLAMVLAMSLAAFVACDFLPAETVTVTKTTTPAPVKDETVTAMVEVTKTVTVTEFVTVMVDPSTATVTVTVTTTPEEGDVIEVEFRDVESEPSVILELKKGGNVVLKVMETLLVEPTLIFYTAIWTPDLGQYYWYGYAEWNKEWPQYTFGFAATAAPGVGNYNSSLSNTEATVIVSPDGDNIEWNDKEAYLGLMEKLCGAMEEIGSYETVIQLLDSGVPGSASELIAEQERLLDKVSSSDYDEALAQMAKTLPYQGTEVSNPGDVTYEELGPVVSAIEASVIVISTAADLACPNPLAGACFATGNKGGFAIGGFNAA